MIKTFYILLCCIMLMALPGCGVIEGIFKAGVWVGVLIVAAVIGLIIWLVMKARK